MNETANIYIHSLIDRVEYLEGLAINTYLNIEQFGEVCSDNLQALKELTKEKGVI